MSKELVPVPDASLETNPVEYMAVALNRAKGWLSEAQSIEEVRETKAIAVGYENVIREKELAFDAQLSATEIVRRCERRIGELVREGQRDGRIAQKGSIGGGHYGGGSHGNHLQRVPDAVGVQGSDKGAIQAHYAMADVPAEQFEAAINDARDEGNLSRANVTRKVKGEKPPPAGRSKWHYKKRHIDSNRILRTLAQELDALTTGLELMEPVDLDPMVKQECLPLIDHAIRIIRRHVRRIQ